MPDISVCIVNWNVEALLRACLRSIFANTKAASFEVIMVDNASSDASAEMVRREFPQVTLIENRTNAGFTKANNQAISVSKGRYVMILNPDTELVGDALSAMKKFMDEHPGCGALGPKLLNPDGSLQRSCKTFPTLEVLLYNALFLDALFPKSKLFGKHFMTWWDFDEVREVEQPMGSAIMIRRGTLDQVGLFDQNIFIWFDEVDLLYRIKQAGWKIYFTPDAKIIHHLSRSFKQWDFWQALKSNYIYRKSRDYFFRKNYGAFSANVLFLIDALQIALVIALLYGIFKLAALFLGAFHA